MAAGVITVSLECAQEVTGQDEHVVAHRAQMLPWVHQHWGAPGGGGGGGLAIAAGDKPAAWGRC